MPANIQIKTQPESASNMIVDIIVEKIGKKWDKVENYF